MTAKPGWATGLPLIAAVQVIPRGHADLLLVVLHLVVQLLIELGEGQSRHQRRGLSPCPASPSHFPSAQAGAGEGTGQIAVLPVTPQPLPSPHAAVPTTTL